MRHGYYALLITLKKGHLDRRTLLGRYQMDQEKELAAALGGDPSPQEAVLIRDTVKSMLYLGSIDAYLTGLKSAVKRGHLHPIITQRTKLAGHIRENLKALGLKRVQKQITLEDILNEDQPSEQEQQDKGGGEN